MRPVTTDRLLTAFAGIVLVGVVALCVWSWWARIVVGGLVVLLVVWLGWIRLSDERWHAQQIAQARRNVDAAVRAAGGVPPTQEEIDAIGWRAINWRP